MHLLCIEVGGGKGEVQLMPVHKTGLHEWIRDRFESCNSIQIFIFQSRILKSQFNN